MKGKKDEDEDEDEEDENANDIREVWIERN